MEKYRMLSKLVQARKNTIDNQNSHWQEKHENTIAKIMATAPIGSGINSGTFFDVDKSTKDKLIFWVCFEHMNERGFYTEKTAHKIIVTPSLANKYEVKITGKNKNNIKSYLIDLYCTWFEEDFYF